MLSDYTRQHPKVTLGASPRASLALLRAAKAHALLVGRSYATPDDVRIMAVPVLAHRIVLLPEFEAERGARAGVVEEALARVGYRRSPKAG